MEEMKKYHFFDKNMLGRPAARYSRRKKDERKEEVSTIGE